MKNFKFRFVLAAISLMSILTLTFTANAAPVKFNQVVQVVNVKPGNAKNGAFAQLRLANDLLLFGNNDGDDNPNTPQQDDRVITEIKTDVVEDEVCDCVDSVEKKRGFPKWALLGLAAIPLIFIIVPPNKRHTPTPTPPPPTPTITPPPPTPTITPPPPTPTMTPTPPPEPVPEPMTILLFGTGLAGIGMAARRKFGKKGADKTEE